MLRGAFLQSKWFVVYCLKMCPSQKHRYAHYFAEAFVFLGPLLVQLAFMNVVSTNISPKCVCLTWQGVSIPQNWGNHQTRLLPSRNAMQDRGEGGATLAKTAQGWYRLTLSCSRFILVSTLNGLMLSKGNEKGWEPYKSQITAESSTFLLGPDSTV